MLEHEIKILERVFERRIRGAITISDIQMGFIPGESTVTPYLLQGCSHGGPGGKLPPKNLFCPPPAPQKNCLVVSSEFLLHFRPNRNQNNNS